MKFKPGQSGNPGGRPAIMAEARRLAQSFTEESILGLMELARDKGQSGQVRLSAYNSVLDRALGKPVAINEHSGPEGSPIQHQSLEDGRKALHDFMTEFAAKRSGDAAAT